MPEAESTCETCVYLHSMGEEGSFHGVSWYCVANGMVSHGGEAARWSYPFARPSNPVCRHYKEAKTKLEDTA